LEDVEEYVLIPSFWISPLVFIGRLSEKTGIAQFGIRPKTVSLVPGEAIPEGLALPLQALSDTTRLRILRLLNENPMTQAQIAKALRLRAPTITHHIKILRFANLIVPAPCASGEKRYTMREASMKETWNVLADFLKLGSKRQEGN
jgi:DNA-binding transcriptional ArsR family regulator